MASIKPHNGKWRVFIFKAGVRKTKVLNTKTAAQAWAAQTEADITTGKAGGIPNKTFADLLNRYAEEVSPTKRGERWERLRIGLTLRDPVASVHLRDFDSRAVAAWRDRRLGQVSAASVHREWNLLSNACTIAVLEWKWLRDNPFREVKRPAEPEARDRIATDDELDKLLFALGYDKEATPLTASARVGAVMLFAIETAMRAGEIAGLAWSSVKLDKRFCRVEGGKTSAAKRDVPLSAEAIRIIEQMPRDADTVFNVTASQIDSLFRKAKGKAMIEDLHFHDTRHLAITRLARKLDVLALARMVGHRDLRMLQLYYNESAEDMAGRL